MSGLPGRRRGKPPLTRPPLKVYRYTVEATDIYRLTKEDIDNAGVKLIGHCEDCKWWDEIPSTGCPIVITTEAPDDDEHITPPDFGCVRWEAKDE